MRCTADIDAKNNDGDTPLHYGHTDIILALIAKNNDGDTPLQCACSNGHTDIALALIDIFADISAKNNFGEMPLHWACSNDHRDINIKWRTQIGDRYRFLVVCDKIMGSKSESRFLNIDVLRNSVLCALRDK